MKRSPLSALVVFISVLPIHVAASPSDPFFDSVRILEIDIKLALQDWTTMRYEHHNLFNRTSGTENKERPNPYSYYHGSVTIDGETVENVGLR